MYIGVLGPIEVMAAGQPIWLAGGRQRAMLASLVLDHGKVVSTARLIDVLWDGNPPATARTKIYAYVSALRQAFGHQEGAGTVVTCPPGYVLRRDGVTIDLAEFKLLADRGRAALIAGDAAGAAGHFQEALTLWRGRPFADVSSTAIRDAAVGIEERYLLTLEAKAEADLALGQADAVAAQVGEWLAEHPLRERMRALQMLALCRLGCRADALAVYREGRRAMVEELGLEPGPELRRLHQRILAEDGGAHAARGKRAIRPVARRATRALRPHALAESAYSTYGLASETASRI